jgi:hypothetical protein
MSNLYAQLFELYRQERLRVNLNEQQLKSLIDVVLVLGDREWFLELAMQLKEAAK